jgi:hypothetical protein
MTAEDFVPPDFEPPTSLVTDDFRLEPLGPQHNEADHAAWTSGIEHVRSTPGFVGSSWPPREGMTLEEDLADRAGPLADALARWLADDWPWKRLDRPGR